MSSASEPAPAFVPRRVTVSRSAGLEIQWGDGHLSQYEPGYLRQRCPCARCTPAHDSPTKTVSPFPILKPVSRLEGAEQVGSYALRLKWSDGHDTGINTWEYLRGICPCPECSAGA